MKLKCDGCIMLRGCCLIRLFPSDFSPSLPPTLVLRAHWGLLPEVCECVNTVAVEMRRWTVCIFLLFSCALLSLAFSCSLPWLQPSVCWAASQPAPEGEGQLDGRTWLWREIQFIKTQCHWGHKSIVSRVNSQTKGVNMLFLCSQWTCKRLFRAWKYALLVMFCDLFIWT